MTSEQLDDKDQLANLLRKIRAAFAHINSGISGNHQHKSWRHWSDCAPSIRGQNIRVWAGPTACNNVGGPNPILDAIINILILPPDLLQIFTVLEDCITCIYICFIYI